LAERKTLAGMDLRKGHISKTYVSDEYQPLLSSRTDESSAQAGNANAGKTH